MKDNIQPRQIQLQMESILQLLAFRQFYLGVIQVNGSEDRRTILPSSVFPEFTASPLALAHLEIHLYCINVDVSIKSLDLLSSEDIGPLSFPVSSRERMKD